VTFNPHCDKLDWENSLQGETPISVPSTITSANFASLNTVVPDLKNYNLAKFDITISKTNSVVAIGLSETGLENGVTDKMLAFRLGKYQ